MGEKNFHKALPDEYAEVVDAHLPRWRKLDAREATTVGILWIGAMIAKRLTNGFPPEES
jgi:hypothetical protein